MARAEAPTGEGAGGRRRRLRVWQESLVLLVVAVLLAVAVKSLLVQAFYIPSESMEPGLVEDDRILVQKLSYRFGGEPERGDVVVFEDPGSWLEPETTGETSAVGRVLGWVGLRPAGGHLVKRVVGVAGDTIVCCDDQGRLAVNGEPLEEDAYVRDADTVTCRGPQVPTCSWTAGPVPEGSLFVMGDNRERSADSSRHLCPPEAADCADDPYVPVENVVGKVFLLVWPAGRLDRLDRPDTFADVPDPGPGD